MTRSWWWQVPEKIKDLEINYSFLQSYMQESKKQYDEAFEDLQAEIKKLQTTLTDMRTKGEALTLDTAERVRNLENRTAAWGAAQREQARVATLDHARLLEQLAAAQAKQRWWLHLETLALLAVVWVVSVGVRQHPGGGAAARVDAMILYLVRNIETAGYAETSWQRRMGRAVAFVLGVARGRNAHASNDLSSASRKRQGTWSSSTNNLLVPPSTQTPPRTHPLYRPLPSGPRPSTLNSPPWILEQDPTTLRPTARVGKSTERVRWNLGDDRGGGQPLIARSQSMMNVAGLTRPGAPTLRMDNGHARGEVRLLSS